MKKITLTRNQVELAAKFGLSAKEYAKALMDLKKYNRREKKLINNCDERFLAWVSKAYSELPEGQDFPAPDEFMLEVWQAAWRSAYSSGIMQGQKQGRMQIEKFNKQTRTPMSYSTMEDLFEGCKNGREYGLKIERWHGIFPTDEDRALDEWHVKQFGHKV
jgi:hypothetical protein